MGTLICLSPCTIEAAGGKSFYRKLADGRHSCRRDCARTGGPSGEVAGPPRLILRGRVGSRRAGALRSVDLKIEAQAQRKENGFAHVHIHLTASEGMAEVAQVLELGSGDRAPPFGELPGSVRREIESPEQIIGMAGARKGRTSHAANADRFAPGGTAVQ